MAEKIPCPECSQPFEPRGLPFHRAAKHGIPLTPKTGLAEVERAKLAEEYNAHLTAKDTEIATLKEQVAQLTEQLSHAPLAEEPPELSDEERFQSLTDSILSLSPDGKARLAEEVGLTFREEKEKATMAEEIEAPKPEPLPAVTVVRKPRFIIAVKKNPTS